MQSLDDDQAVEVVSIPLAGKSSIADHMVIAIGPLVAPGRVDGDQARREDQAAVRQDRSRIEGLPVADWVLIDADDVIVHLFRPEVRTFYNLERMWAFGDEAAAERGRRRLDRLSELLLHIIARGKIGRSPEAELIDRYLKRIAWPTKLTELPDRGGTLPGRAANSVTVVLDERGEALSSMALAKKLESWRDGGKREARFLIGAADGHGDAGAGRGRPAAVLRPGDLAASAGPGDARRAIVPRHLDPCEPPLSS